MLIAPPGGGNIGDQAMVEAYLAGADGAILLVTSGAGSIEVPAGEAERVTEVALPDLLYAGRRRRDRAVRSFRRLLDRAASVSIVGADIMDGAYVPSASIARATIAQAAARRGIDTRILGFSWPESPLPAARRSLRAAERAGVAVLPRDPVSAARLRDDGIPPTRQVADIVFSTRSRNPGVRDEVSGRYAIVNVSGHIGRSLDLTADYERVVDGLLARGLAVVVLPHVASASADDRIPSRALAARFGTRVRLIDRVLAPVEVRGLAADAEITVTGRMHLAIQSLMFGVPAVTLATQGKVEGLMTMLDTPSLCVEPRAGFADEVLRTVDAALPEGSAVRRRLVAALPAVFALADGNTAGLHAEALHA